MNRERYNELMKMWDIETLLEELGIDPEGEDPETGYNNTFVALTMLVKPVYVEEVVEGKA